MPPGCKKQKAREASRSREKCHQESSETANANMIDPVGRVVTVPPVLRRLRDLTTGVLAKGAVIAMLATPIVRRSGRLRAGRVHQPGLVQGGVGAGRGEARAGGSLRALRVHGGRRVSAQGARGSGVRRVPGRHRVRPEGRGPRQQGARDRASATCRLEAGTSKSNRRHAPAPSAKAGIARNPQRVRIRRVRTSRLR